MTLHEMAYLPRCSSGCSWINRFYSHRREDKMAGVTTYSRAIVSLLNPAQEVLANQWLDSRAESEALVAQLHPQIYPKSKTRYRFVANAEEATAKAIFEAAFQKTPELVIAAAETAAGTSCYPLWKRVVRIH